MTIEELRRTILVLVFDEPLVDDISYTDVINELPKVTKEGVFLVQGV